MSKEINQASVRRYYEEAKNQGKLELLPALVDPDYVEHNPIPGQGSGLAGLRQRAELLQRAFELHITVDDILAEGDRVAVRFTNHVVQRGTFLGIPATGKTAAFSGIAIHRMEDGKTAERWIFVDNLSLLQQLGAVPQPSAGAM